jgi:hypothetical protein
MGNFIIYTLPIKKDKVDKTCRMRGKMRNSCTGLVGTPDGKRLLVLLQNHIAGLCASTYPSVPEQNLVVQGSD